ncbi:MAG: hypothetical protein QOG34_1190 [Frankiaceae bacterium]|jgi:hypothetical protein|nr:hypothetical protein [Frankiaceae bacterium]
MPRSVVTTPPHRHLLDSQDGVVSAGQLMHAGISRATADKRVARHVWRRLLPGIYLTNAGAATRRQAIVAAWLWGGDACAIDGPDACNWYGVRIERHVRAPIHIVVPFGSRVRSRDFVVVRRSVADIEIADRGLVPYVDLPTALIVTARNSPSFRDAIGLLSRPLQLGQVDQEGLLRARERIGDKWCRQLDSALVAVGVGLRSPGEKDLHDTVCTSRVLPDPEWNAWLDLGDGAGLVCVDALWRDAGLANEVNGRKWHAWGERFERTEERRSRLVAAGIVVQSCTPTQLRTSRAAVLARLEQAYLLNRGRGLPPGVEVAHPNQLPDRPHRSPLSGN